jgi:hypothetical protein
MEENNMKYEFSANFEISVNPDSINSEEKQAAFLAQVSELCEKVLRENGFSNASLMIANSRQF